MRCLGSKCLGRKRENMTKAIHSGRREASAPGKTRAGRSAYVMNPECLALIDNFRLMDDTFMSKCLENAPECIELILHDGHRKIDA